MRSVQWAHILLCRFSLTPTVPHSGHPSRIHMSLRVREGCASIGRTVRFTHAFPKQRLLHGTRSVKAVLPHDLLFSHRPEHHSSLSPSAAARASSRMALSSVAS